MSKLLESADVVLQDGSNQKAGPQLEGKIVALYFTAKFVRLNPELSPQLKAFYDEVNIGTKHFEVVQVSWDASKEDYDDYFKHSGFKWLRLPYGDQTTKELNSHYHIETVPALKVVDSDGDVIVANAAEDLNKMNHDNGAGSAVELFTQWKDKVAKHERAKPARDGASTPSEP